MMVRAMLADMSIVSYTAGVVTLACDERIRGTAENKLPELAQLMSSLASTRIECRLAEATVKPERSGTDDPVVHSSGEIEIDDPVIRHAIEVFKGRIVEVKPLARPTGEETS